MKESICEDIDECRTDSDLCHADAQCINTPGSGYSLGVAVKFVSGTTFGKSKVKVHMSVKVTKDIKVMKINVKTLMNAQKELTMSAALILPASTMLVVSHVFVTLVSLVKSRAVMLTNVSMRLTTVLAMLYVQIMRVVLAVYVRSVSKRLILQPLLVLQKPSNVLTPTNVDLEHINAFR